MNDLVLAVLALAPVMIGPLPQDDLTISTLLCRGDQIIEIEIPISRDGPAHDSPCHSKGCHGGPCRKKLTGLDDQDD